MTMDTDAKKRRAALAALELVPAGAVIGVGTGSTVNLFIEALAAAPGRVRHRGVELRGEQRAAAGRRHPRSSTSTR